MHTRNLYHTAIRYIAEYQLAGSPTKCIRHLCISRIYARVCICGAAAQRWSPVSQYTPLYSYCCTAVITSRLPGSPPRIPPLPLLHSPVCTKAKHAISPIQAEHIHCSYKRPSHPATRPNAACHGDQNSTNTDKATESIPAPSLDSVLNHHTKHSARQLNCAPPAIGGPPEAEQLATQEYIYCKYYAFCRRNRP